MKLQRLSKGFRGISWNVNDVSEGLRGVPVVSRFFFWGVSGVFLGFQVGFGRFSEGFRRFPKPPETDSMAFPEKSFLGKQGWHNPQCVCTFVRFNMKLTCTVNIFSAECHPGRKDISRKTFSENPMEWYQERYNSWNGIFPGKLLSPHFSRLNKSQHFQIDAHSLTHYGTEWYPLNYLNMDFSSISKSLRKQKIY